MSKIFDPTAFLDQTTEQASERRNPLPAIDYNAVIKDVKMTTWESKEKVDEESGELKSGVKFDIVLDMDLSEEIKAACSIEKGMILTDGFIADMNSSKTALDYGKGKNNRLRMYRDATDMNVAGQSFSPRMLVGRMVRVRVTHEEYKGAIQERIGAVSKAV